MKALTKIGALAVAGILAGAGATMYAAPGAFTSTDEAVTRGVALQTRMKADLEKIAELSLKAKKSRDILKVNCVNDKYVLAKPLMNVADRLILDIEVSGHATPAASLTSLNNNAEEMRQLRESATACVDSTVLGADSSNSFSHPEVTNVFGSYPTAGGYIEPPIYASPVR